MNTKTVAIFGVFDGIHEGHREFITQARAYGDRLVAIVARDSAVEKLKGKLPVYNEADRIEALLQVPEIDLVLLGDAEEGTYKALKEIDPGVIYLGYDQKSLFDSIRIAIGNGILSNIELIFGIPHKPEIFHSSILNASHEPSDEKLPELQ
ncbi:MAG: adenylyltransferase/cytidyltransferase family protein [Patescibacteria group bacterium]